jgi:molybdopterin synthase sulfur carrier subunit
MRVRVLYFAVVRELVGRDEESVELPSEARTVAGFTRWIAGLHPALEGRMASVRIARNEAFARDEDELAEADVLALLPPVAGG